MLERGKDSLSPILPYRPAAIDPVTRAMTLETVCHLYSGPVSDEAKISALASGRPSDSRVLRYTLVGKS